MISRIRKSLRRWPFSRKSVIIIDPCGQRINQRHLDACAAAVANTMDRLETGRNCHDWLYEFATANSDFVPLMVIGVINGETTFSCASVLQDLVNNEKLIPAIAQAAKPYIEHALACNEAVEELKKQVER